MPAADAGGAEHLAGFPRRESQVRVVPRQLHQRLDAGRRLRPGRGLCRRAAANWCIATSRPGKRAAMRFLYPEIGALDAQLRQAGGSLQRLAEIVTGRRTAALADDRQPPVGAAARPRPGRAAGRHGTARVEHAICSTGSRKISSRTITISNTRSKSSARRALISSRLWRSARKGGVCLSRSAHAAAYRGAVSRCGLHPWEQLETPPRFARI